MEPRIWIFRASALFFVGAIAGLCAFAGGDRWPFAEFMFVGAFAAGLVMLALSGLSHGPQQQGRPRPHDRRRGG